MPMNPKINIFLNRRNSLNQMIAKQSKCSVHKTTVGNLLITQEINGTINDLREESFFLWSHCCE